jgi:opacity protein-like surface antigen
VTWKPDHESDVAPRDLRASHVARCVTKRVARRTSMFRLFGVLVFVALSATTARAQGSGSGFLFQQPLGSITLSGGFAHATAGGDLFSFVTDNLTLNKSDFSGPIFGADLAVRVTPQIDVVLGTSYAGMSRSSSYRHLVDNNDAEIVQQTEFRRVPVMVSVRAYLTPQGRSVGRFAWVPSRFAPYVGAGGGAVWYRFSQNGDFVDFQNNNSVFNAEFTSSNWTPAAQGMAGLDVTLTPRIALTGEAKYIWAKGKLDQSFSGFDNIDLSGVSTTIGLTFRY